MKMEQLGQAKLGCLSVILSLAFVVIFILGAIFGAFGVWTLEIHVAFKVALTCVIVSMIVMLFAAITPDGM